MPNDHTNHGVAGAKSLRAKVGGRISSMEDSAIAQAEAALEALSGNFQGWLETELDQLEAARATLAANRSMDAIAKVHKHAHDMKGLGSTYKYPIITRIADSLCRLLDARAINTPQTLINGHLDAIKAILRQRIQTEDHPVGQALATELERLVKAEMKTNSTTTTA